ncbi:uncharacterized protein LOC132717440 [Ruditapes philippinarum]|uniref:uncharacterized protein LOC132717440 n=1 Tax=Ruditapes philippinarum TaxID=129788 RepID=UPI00295B6C27|nr:uncharacterized protein LOC132717440 [Ruditapes philippinarum]
MKYDEVMRDQLSKGVIEKVEKSPVDSENTSEAIQLYTKSKAMFADASMNLREWITNSEFVNEFIPKEDRADTKSVKVLGHYWNVNEDTVTIAEENTTDVNVIFAKTRLAPIKKLTIPRLELLAVLIGLRCLKFVKEQLRVPIEKQYLWTESKCVLQWVTSDKKLPLFVKNRVSKNKEHIDVNMTYIPTRENPADVASRGTTLEKLATDSNWWHGPQWLLKPTSNWPTDYQNK